MRLIYAIWISSQQFSFNYINRLLTVLLGQTVSLANVIVRLLYRLFGKWLVTGIKGAFPFTNAFSLMDTVQFELVQHSLHK